MLDFTSTEIIRQRVYMSELWDVILPKEPYSPHHLMFVVRRKLVLTFAELSDSELIEFKLLVKTITESDAWKGAGLSGYNIFFNAGDEKTGKHILTFHAHVFFRARDEVESPFEAMNSGKHWSVIGSKEWNHQKEAIETFLSSALKN